MKHSLQLRLSQHLTLTPQLQQSIRLLQLSTLELDQEIDRLLQDNPLLEREDSNNEQPSAPPNEGVTQSAGDSAESSPQAEAETAAPCEEATAFDVMDGANYSSGSSSAESDDDDFSPVA